MTTLAYTLSDSRVMLRRNLKHQLRYPSMTVMLIGIPTVLLLLFVYVFGGQLGAGLGAGLGAHEGRSAYLNYVVPGLLLLTVASAIQGTSIMVAMDMTGGIIDRFRTMAIARASVLTGHVLGSLIQTLVAIAVLIAVAFGLGFRSAAGPLHWLAAIGILALFAFALIWLAVALGLAAKSVETASNTPMILFLLLFLSSGFVATATMQRACASSLSTSPSPRRRHRARTAHRHRCRRPRHRRHRLEHRHRCRGLPLGHPPLQPAPSSRATVNGPHRRG
jgi:ABC-2 type transport system permease protein